MMIKGSIPGRYNNYKYILTPNSRTPKYKNDRIERKIERIVEMN